MEGLSFSLLRPSLLRRLLLALLLAFVLVAVALLARDFAHYKGEMARQPALQQLCQFLLSSLSALPQPADAAEVIKRQIDELNTIRNDGDVKLGALKFQLRNRDGQVLASSPGWTAAATAPPQEDPVAEVMIAEEAHWLVQRTRGAWQLLLAEPKLGDVTLLAYIGGDLLPSLLLAFPLVLVPLWLTVWRGLEPLRQLARQIQARSPHELSALPESKPYQELQPLVQAFDRLLARLRQHVQRERNMVQDAAHELRTPLAVVASQASVLAKARTELEKAQAEAALRQALERCSHLGDQLMALAQLDAMQEPQLKMIDLAARTEQALVSLAEQALAKQQELSLDAPQTLQVPCDPMLWDSILLNLVGNALQHVPHGGRIEVSLLQPRPDGLLLRVADDGPGIARDQRQLAFSRFWRGGGAGGKGAGLGLAIVEQAVRRLGGRVSIDDGLAQRGVAFEVSLPLATL
jgi:two-component system sensor histidine kinase QseC